MHWKTVQTEPRPVKVHSVKIHILGSLSLHTLPQVGWWAIRLTRRTPLLKRQTPVTYNSINNGSVTWLRKLGHFKKKSTSYCLTQSKLQVFGPFFLFSFFSFFLFFSFFPVFVSNYPYIQVTTRNDALPKQTTPQNRAKKTQPAALMEII